MPQKKIKIGNGLADAMLRTYMEINALSEVREAKVKQANLIVEGLLRDASEDPDKFQSFEVRKEGDEAFLVGTYLSPPIPPQNQQ